VKRSMVKNSEGMGIHTAVVKGRDDTINELIAQATRLKQTLVAQRTASIRSSFVFVATSSAAKPVGLGIPLFWYHPSEDHAIR